MNFDIIKRAGIYHREFAKLVGVSRVTVSLWVLGRQTPSPLARDKAQSVLDAIEAATTAGNLPLVGRGPHRQKVLDQLLLPR